MRGCSQCWSTTALYIIRVSQSDRRRATLMDTAPSAVPTRLAKRASERFREIAVIKSRTNRFIWPAAVEGTKSRFVRFKTKDDLLNPEPHFRSPNSFGVQQVGTALVKDFPRP